MNIKSIMFWKKKPKLQPAHLEDDEFDSLENQPLNTSNDLNNDAAVERNESEQQYPEHEQPQIAEPVDLPIGITKDRRKADADKKRQNKEKFSLQQGANVFTRWLKSAPYLSLAALIAATFMSYSAAVEFKAVSSFTNSKGQDSTTQVSLEKVPVPKAEYQPIIAFCKNHTPDVTCELVLDKFLVYIKQAESYEDWIFALSSIQAQHQKMIWSINNICIGNAAICKGVASAEMIAYTQKIKLTNR